MKIQKWQYWATIGIIKRGRELTKEIEELERLVRSILDLEDDMDHITDAFYSTKPVEKHLELQGLEVVE